MKFSDFQNIFKEKFGIEHLADIARELGVSAQAVSNWKSRDKVPYKYVSKVRQGLVSLKFKPDVNSITYNTETEKEFNDNKLSNDIEEDVIAISDILLVIAKQIKVFLIIPLIFSIFTILYTIIYLEPTYESSAKIMSSSGVNDVSQVTGLAAQFGLNIPVNNQSRSEWVYPEIIKSRTLAKAMLKRKFDTIEYGPQKSLLKILTYGNTENPKVGLDTLIKAGVDSFIDMVNIEKNGTFYDLTITAKEPLFARNLTISLIDELDSHQRKYNKQKASETRIFIEKRIEQTRLELEIAEETLKDFTNRNRRIENSPSLQLERQRLLREVSVLTGVFTTLKQQLETSKIEEVKDLDYVVVLDPPEAPLYRSSPNRKRIVFIAGFLGLSLGFLIGFIKEYLTKSDHNQNETINEAKFLIIKNFFSLLPSRFIKK